MRTFISKFGQFASPINILSHVSWFPSVSVYLHSITKCHLASTNPNPSISLNLFGNHLRSYEILQYIYSNDSRIQWQSKELLLHRECDRSICPATALSHMSENIASIDQWVILHNGLMASLKSSILHFQVDFDDGHCPSWRNQIEGHSNIIRFVSGEMQGWLASVWSSFTLVIQNLTLTSIAFKVNLVSLVIFYSNNSSEKLYIASIPHGRFRVEVVSYLW